MCALKYGIWNIQALEPGSVNALVGGGYAPLPAMVLASRGMKTVREAGEYLDCNAELYDPFLMTDMDLAAGRVGLAMERVLPWPMGKKSPFSVTTMWTASPLPAC